MFNVNNYDIIIMELRTNRGIKLEIKWCIVANRKLILIRDQNERANVGCQRPIM